jgi:hypothetical protein
MKNEYNNVAICRITFYKFDDDGNEENEDGTIKEFKLKPVRFKPIEYLCEDLNPEYLVEIKGEEK